MGEDLGRFFLRQLIDAIEYLHRKGIVHRDLKLENILVDELMNLKIVDFGFATYKNIKKLQSYKGTRVYMAPEIKKKAQYDGRKVDVFSTGVILFVIVNGIFPFKEASRTDPYYNLLKQGRHDKYWFKVGLSGLSQDFKTLILKMLAPDPADRPSFSQLREDPWLKNEVDFERCRQ